jgi:hypothetical protein
MAEIPVWVTMRFGWTVGLSAGFKKNTSVVK